MSNKPNFKQVEGVHTPRVEFHDSESKACYMQNGDTVRGNLPSLWIGVGGSSALLLTPKMAAEMIPFLQHFADTGSLVEDTKVLTFDIAGCDNATYVDAVETMMDELGIEFASLEVHGNRLTVHLQEDLATLKSRLAKP